MEVRNIVAARIRKSFSSQAGSSESWTEEVVYVPAEGHERPRPNQSPVSPAPALPVCGAVCGRRWPGVPSPAVRGVWRQQRFTGYLRQHAAIWVCRAGAAGEQDLLWNESGPVTRYVQEHLPAMIYGCYRCNSTDRSVSSVWNNLTPLRLNWLWCQLFIESCMN